MTRLSIANELEDAAYQIADISRADLQVMLRRAAQMLKNLTGVVLEPNVDDNLAGLEAEMRVSNPDLIK